MPRRSRTLLSAKIFRTSSSTTSTFLPTSASSDRCKRSSIFCFSGGRLATTRCRNNAVSSSKRSGDSTPLTTTLRAKVCKRASSSGESSFPVKTTTGNSLKQRIAECIPGSQSPSCRANENREPCNQMSLDSEPPKRHYRLPRPRYRRHRRPAAPEWSVVQHGYPRRSADACDAGSILLYLVQRRGQAFGRGGFCNERECSARQAVLTIFIERQHLHRNVSVVGSCFR